METTPKGKALKSTFADETAIRSITPMTPKVKVTRDNDRPTVSEDIHDSMFTTHKNRPTIVHKILCCDTNERFKIRTHPHLGDVFLTYRGTLKFVHPKVSGEDELKSSWLAYLINDPYLVVHQEPIVLNEMQKDSLNVVRKLYEADWVSRDDDNALHFFETKPSKADGIWMDAHGRIPCGAFEKLDLDVPKGELWNISDALETNATSVNQGPHSK